MRTLLQVTTFLCFFLVSHAGAAEYTIDGDHTRVLFKIRHLGISTVTGSFGEFQGQFSFDPENVSKSKVEASIKSESIDTGVEKRDKHLRSGDFFNVDKFPKLRYVSKEVKPLGEGKFQIIGDLTMHGVTKEVTLNTELGGMAKDPWGKERVAFIATAELNRKDFGLKWNKVLETGGLVVGEMVKIEIEVEGIKKAS